MLTKESKILIKNVWESKKYGVTWLTKEFSNKKWSKRGVEDFLKQLWSTRSIERAPGSGRCEPCHRRVEASSVSLCWRWRQTFWALLMIATLKITMSKWQHYEFDNWRWLSVLFCSERKWTKNNSVFNWKLFLFTFYEVRCAHN